MNNPVEQVIAAKVEEATKAIEEKVDSEIEKLQNLDLSDIEALRQRRLENMKKEAKLEMEWLSLGHGVYSELPEEKEFFAVAKKSNNMICHFYREATFRCKIVDKHLQLLAPKHLEARFCKIDAEKCPFLTDRLSVRVLPSILLLKNNELVDRIVGFTELGNTDEFPTEMMEWRLAQHDVIKYAGDKNVPPEIDTKRKPRTQFVRKTIRSNTYSDSDEDQDDCDE